MKKQSKVIKVTKVQIADAINGLINLRKELYEQIGRITFSQRIEQMYNTSNNGPSPSNYYSEIERALESIRQTNTQIQTLEMLGYNQLPCGTLVAKKGVKNGKK